MKGNDLSGRTISDLNDYLNSLERELLPFFRNLLRLFRENTNEISPAQLFILKQIAEQDPVHSRELAEELHISCAGVSQLISQLINQELIQKSRSAEDGRVYNLSLTRSGAEVLAGNMEIQMELLQRIFSTLSLEEQRAFLSIINKLKNNLEREG